MEKDFQVRFKEKLQMLENSPIVEIEYFHRISNLCEAIKTVACKILDDTDYIDTHPDESKERREKHLRELSSAACQTIAISEIIDEMACRFSGFVDLIYFCREVRKEGKTSIEI